MTETPRTATHRPVLSERFYGRARELGRIDALLASALVAPAPRLLLVSGPPGIGKSALVQRLVLDARAQLVVHARARPQSLHTPLGTLAAALGARHADSLAEASSRVVSRGAVLASLREELGQVASGRVAVVLLEDIQWLDTASIHLVSELVATSAGQPLVVVATRRDRDSTAFPRLRNVSREVLDLPALELEDIERFVADSLSTDSLTSGGLAQLVHQRTGGNPFFASQLLVSLAEEGVLTYDESARAWRWDDARLRATGYTENVVELVGTRIDRLSHDAARALEMLACLGSATDSRALAAAHDGAIEDLHATLWAAAAATNIVYRSPVGYTFLHDRVREAAYERIPAEERPRRHLEIGRLLLDRLEPRMPADVFVILEQLNRALPLLRSEERAVVGRLNLEAAAQSRAVREWASAYGYVAAAVELANGDSFDLALELAELGLRQGKGDEAWLDDLLALADTRLRRLKVFGLFSTLGSLAEPHARSVATFRRALEHFEVVLVAAPPTIDATRLATLPPCVDEEAAALVDLLAGALPMLRIGCPELYPPVASTALSLAAASGWTPTLAYLLGHHALLLVQDRAQSVRALDLVDRALTLDATRGAARHRAALSYIRTCRVVPAITKQPPSKEAIDEAVTECLAVGDVRYLGWVVLEGIWYALVREPQLETVCELAAKYAALTSSICAAAAAVRILQASFTRLLGRDEPVPYDAHEVIRRSEHGPGLAIVSLGELVVAFLEGRIEDAHAALTALRPHAPALAGTICEPSFELFQELVVTATRGPDLEGAFGAREEHALEPGTDAAALIDLASAERARVDGRELDAMRGYESSLVAAHARAAGFHHALAFELAARFYRSRGFLGIALGHVRAALHAYQRWGAHAKAALVERDWLALQQEALSRGRPGVGGAELLDVQALVQIGRIGTYEGDLEGIVRRVARSAVETLQVQRACLFLAHETGVRAEVRAERSAPEIVDTWRPAVSEETLEHVASVFRAEQPATNEGALHVPLVRRGVVVAVLQVEAFSDEARRPLLAVLAEQAAVAIAAALDAEALRNERAERRRLEEALRRSRALLEVAESLSRTGTFVWMPTSSHYLHWSNEMRRIGGFDRTPTLADTFERTHPEDRARVSAAIERGSLLGTDIELDHRFLLPDGTVRYVQTRARKIKSEPEVEFVGVTVDVTDHEHALAAVRLSEERLREVVDTIPALAWQAGANGDGAFFSQRWLDYTGLTMERAAGWQWLQALHPDDEPRLSASWRIHLGTGEPLEAEIRLRRHDGSHRWFLVRVEPLRAGAGAGIVSWYGTYTDIEDRKRAEEALYQTRTELSHVNRVTTVGELAASIAHEINQPLAAIVADASAAQRWLGASTPNLGAALESLSSIERDGIRVSEVLDRIRALLSRRAIASARCDVTALVEGVLPLVQPELARSGVSIQLHPGDDPVVVEGDLVQLQQVLINLIMNARDACRELPPDRRQLQIRVGTMLRGARRFAHVAVEDSGMGLDGDASKLFEAFFTTKLDGLGMGLAISRSIVERHGGTLWGESNEGHGATFHVNLPATLIEPA